MILIAATEGIVCNSFEYKCEQENKCISKDLVCDDDIDCEIGDDEINCKESKSML